jgi:hypothetical protein
MVPGGSSVGRSQGRSLWTRPRRCLADGRGDADSEAQKAPHFHRRADKPGQWGSPPWSSSASMVPTAFADESRRPHPPKPGPSRLSFQNDERGGRGSRAKGVPQRAAQSARRAVCHRRSATIRGKIRVRRPATGLGGSSIGAERQGRDHLPDSALTLVAPIPIAAATGPLGSVLVA